MTSLIFLGSFDPPHDGHLEVIELALTLGWSHVYVLTNAPNKKRRVDLVHRINMMKLTFGHRVIIVEEDIDSFMKTVGCNVAAIIGSDRVIQLQHHPDQLRYRPSGWVVSIRPSHTLSEINQLCGIPVLVTFRQTLDYSSTDVRLSYQLGGSSSLVNLATSLYINDHQLYVEGVEQWLAGRSVSLPKIRGKSSSRVLISIDRVVKITKNLEEYDNQQYLEDRSVSCVNVYEYKIINQELFMLMPNYYSLGYVTLYELLNDDQVKITIKKRILKRCCRDLKRLHTVKAGVIVCHGDPSPKNIMVNPNIKPCVIWLDFGKTKKLSDFDPSLIAREFYQFMSSLQHCCIKDAAKYENLIFGAYNPDFTAEDHIHWRQYWFNR